MDHFSGPVTTGSSEYLHFSDLKYSGGIGFRFRLADAVVSRIDFAVGREGFRWMWTFADIYRVRY